MRRRKRKKINEDKGKMKSDIKVEGNGEMECERNEKCWRKC